MINWNAVEHINRQSQGEVASIYYGSKGDKKSAAYTLQLHIGAPTELVSAKEVSFGFSDGAVFITAENKGQRFKASPKSRRGKDGAIASTSISGKALIDKILRVKGVPTGVGYLKLRLTLEKVQTAPYNVWEIKIKEDDGIKFM